MPACTVAEGPGSWLMIASSSTGIAEGTSRGPVGERFRALAVTMETRFGCTASRAGSVSGPKLPMMASNVEARPGTSGRGVPDQLVGPAAVLEKRDASLQHALLVWAANSAVAAGRPFTETRPRCPPAAPAVRRTAAARRRAAGGRQRQLKHGRALRRDGDNRLRRILRLPAVGKPELEPDVRVIERLVIEEAVRGFSP